MPSADRPNLLRCWMSCREWEAAGLIEVEPDLRPRMQAMVHYMACRTVVFDEFFLEATGAGVRQAAILAVGLDSRAWRLPWPDATTVYEFDQPKVLEFKSSTLRQHGAQPTSSQVDVAVDLRQVWPKALQQAGFDVSAPSVWASRRDLPARSPSTLVLTSRLSMICATARMPVTGPFMSGFDCRPGAWKYRFGPFCKAYGPTSTNVSPIDGAGASAMENRSNSRRNLTSSRHRFSSLCGLCMTSPRGWRRLKPSGNSAQR